MAEPARQSDLGEDLLSRQQEEQARQWIQEARAASAARREGREAPPRPRRGREAIDGLKPTAPVDNKASAFKQIQPHQITEEELEEMNAQANKEGRMARALRKRLEAARRARAEKYKATGLAGEAGVKRFLNRYRQIKTIIRVIKVGSAVGTAFGDVFFSIWVLFLSINGERIGEWLLVKFRPQYQEQLAEQKKKDPFRLFDDLLFYGGWLLIIIVLLLAVALIVFLFQQFGNLGGAAALKFLGR